MTRRRIDITYWLMGLAIFGCLIASSLLFRGDAEFGITDHQSAGTAARVDAIQADWRAARLREIVIVSMIGDLIFIAVYSYGAWRAGKSLRTGPKGWLSTLGLVIVGAAIVFFVSDMIETVLQLIQMLADQGTDWMAATAATAQPIKVAAWLMTFVGVIAALVIDWIARRLNPLQDGPGAG